MALRSLVLGSGGREHALAWRLARDPGVEVLVAPGNERIAVRHRCAPVDAVDGIAVAELARRERIDLVVVGPETPLAAGVVDTLERAGIATFGPVRDAARLESSKWFAKEMMAVAGVPTARAERCASLAEVERACDTLGAPFVVKADGLAAGKGVLVTVERAAAISFAAECLEAGRDGGSKPVVVEEFLDGEEASVMAVCDGERCVLLPAARDYKRAWEGDVGPNTGGMGAYAPAPAVDAATERFIVSHIVLPTLKAMAERGARYRGTLYCGLMLGREGVSVVEFNSRFGDPETEVIMPLVTGSFVELLLGAARGRLDPSSTGRAPGAAVAVALVDARYPGSPAGTAAITGLDAIEAGEGIAVFGAGIVRAGAEWRVTGGRAAYVMARADSLAAARGRAYAAVGELGGAGWRYRGDIAAEPGRVRSATHGGTAQ